MRQKEVENTILQTVVVRYLQKPEPIGSVQLSESIALELSSATIRNYFRRLVDEGLLEQLHASSGRIPTPLALRRHWLETLKPDTPLVLGGLERVEQGALNFGLFVLLQPVWYNRLEGVAPLGRDQLAASFEEGVAVLPASAIVARLLEEFIGYDLADLMVIAQNNRVDDLSGALLRLRARQTLRFNTQALIAQAALDPVWSEGFFEPFFDGSVASGQKPGLYFDPVVPAGCMALMQEATIRQKPARLVAFGPTTRDYGGFMNHLSKESR